MFKDLTAFFETTGYFSDNQFGFRKGYNTEHAVLDLVENIRSAIDRSRVTLVVFIDFSVAFNSLYPSYILTTLLAGGLAKESAVWIANAFTGRKFAVICTDGSYTEWYDYSRGFGQGSRGGGLFYNSISAEIPHILDPNCRSHLYADDKTLEHDFLPTDISAGFQFIQHNLNSIMGWAASCGLCLNVLKCKYILFGSPSTLRSVDIGSNTISIDNRNLERVKQFHYLGVWLDESLDWRRQVNLVTSKVFRALRSLSYLRRALDVQTRKLLVRSLCTVHLDYCSAVYSTLDARTAMPLNTSLNACVRFIVNVPRFLSVSPFRKNLGFLSTANRRLYFALIILFKLITSNFPPSLSHTVSLVPHSINRVGRSTNKIKFIIPRSNTAWMARSFSISVVRAWNELPEKIKLAGSVSSFKRSLHAYLVSQER